MEKECICGKLKSILHIYNCEILNVENNPKLKYEEIYNGSLQDQIRIFERKTLYGIAGRLQKYPGKSDASILIHLCSQGGRGAAGRRAPRGRGRPVAEHPQDRMALLGRGAPGVHPARARPHARPAARPRAAAGVLEDAIGGAVARGQRRAGGQLGRLQVRAQQLVKSKKACHHSLTTAS